jgi:arylsulfatase A-like enzyme
MAQVNGGRVVRFWQPVIIAAISASATAESLSPYAAQNNPATAEQGGTHLISTEVPRVLLVASDFPGSEAQFNGKISVNAKDSVPDWPKFTIKPQGAPNILLIMLDDVGFAETSTFGGLAETPVLDRLAAEGLRYNQFHTVGVCSPTRAALLSGRNHHRVGYGAFGGVGYPGYDGIWKKNTVPIAEVMRRNGYSTASFGKWHNTPYHEISPIGPFDRWPTSLGFEYFYGNLLGASSQWEPLLWRNTEMVRPPSRPEHGYHFTTDITNEAIRWVRTHHSLAPEKPYFVYFAPEAAHDPHHVPKEWIDRYRGQFNHGWDKERENIFARQKRMGVIPPDTTLTRRPKELPAWDSLSADQKRLYSREMEVFAAFITHTDHEIGRLIHVVKEGPHADNTLILFIVGDNGAAGAGRVETQATIKERLKDMDELGGPQQAMSFYNVGWAWAGNTPFQWTKRMASHFGATRNPLVVSWPARIKDRGGLRQQFSHVTDIAATLYEAANIAFPDVIDGVQQVPLDGVSLIETFERRDIPSRHRVQYFELYGNRAIYQDGWIAAAHDCIPWLISQEPCGLEPRRSDFSHDRWELYHVDKDFSQAHDLSTQQPKKLRELQAVFDAEARRNEVYPLGAGSILFRPPVWSEGIREFNYYLDSPLSLGPTFAGAQQGDLTIPLRIAADVVIPESGASGVLLAWGGRDGGAALYVKANRLVYENNIGGREREFLTSWEPLPKGEAHLVFELSRDQTKGAHDRIGRLYVNSQLAGETTLSANGIPAFNALLEVGQNSVSLVSEAYEPPFEFTGKLERVTIQSK